MELFTEFPQFEEGQSTRRVKSRSKACLHCRRRKMRCDGAKPSCAQCIRAERGDECEYDDGITKSTTQVLYERLAMLEKRFRELQATKRPARARCTPPYARASSTASASPTNSNANLARSNSAPGRVHSLPGVSSNNTYEQGPSVAKREWRQSFPSNGNGLGMPGSGSGVATADSMMHTPYLQSFDANSSSLGSRFSPPSGRSTPSSSDFSNNELAFYPRTAFMDCAQREVTQMPYAVSNRSDTNMAYTSNDAHGMKVDFPSSGMHSENLRGNFEILFSTPPISSPLNLNSEIPPSIMEHLMDTFITHSQQVGITIPSHSFADLSCVFTSSFSTPTSCLANCVLLWGAHFSPNKALHAYKEKFLHSALATLPSLLSEPLAVAPEFQLAGSSAVPGINPQTIGTSGYNVMVATAASTMLATYFFAESRALEGSYHTDMASQLAICAGLHSTPDPRAWRDGDSSGVGGHPNAADSAFGCGERGMSSNSQTTQTTSGAELLPPPTSQYHALERQHVLWNAFVLDRGWSAVGRLPAPSSRWGVGSRDAARTGDVLKEKDPRTAITTPWPEDWGLLIVGDPEWSRHTTASAPSGFPVEDLLTGRDVRPTHSILEFRAKSSALFEAASRITSLRNPNNPKSCYGANHASLQRTISTFLKNLSPLPTRDFRPASFAKCSPYTSHTLTHAAIIRLNIRLAEKACAKFHSQALMSKGNSVQTLRDGLLGYDRMLSRSGVSNLSGHKECSPAESAGMRCAAVDLCLSSAREIVRIASCLAPDDCAFLEPIIAPCWALAGEVLSNELRHLPSGSQHSNKSSLLSEIRVLETSLKYLGSVFRIGNIEAQKLSSALSQLNPY